MIRLISDRTDFKNNEYLQDFFSRIKMLIIMSKAFLGGYPLKKERLEEIAAAADQVIKDCVEWNGQVQNFRSMAESEHRFQFNHIFYQRIKLLATMAKSFAGGNPMGYYRKIALENNLNDLCSMMKYVPRKDELQKINVA